MSSEIIDNNTIIQCIQKLIQLRKQRTHMQPVIPLESKQDMIDQLLSYKSRGIESNLAFSYKLFSLNDISTFLQ